MARKNTDTPLSKTFSVVWCVSNWGVPIDIARTRKDAKRKAEEHTGYPWAACREYIEIRKVRLTEITAQRRGESR